MISRDTIGIILETARIEEVVGDFVQLRRRGVNLIGLCPFHNEKTPSFNVSPARGIFKCFGCGKAGNAVGFIMEHEHFSYPEALRYLARKYNIDLKEEEETAEQIREKGERESLMAVNAFAQKSFSDILWNTDEGRSVGLSYLKEREFNEKTIRMFQLGYCPGQWDDFTRQARNNGFQMEYLLKTGLTLEKDGRHYDRFRGRILFPIHNLTGRVIGFGARILRSTENKPKYINSPESEIYNKSEVLYGLFFAKNPIIRMDNCYLVEGYTDVISLFQAGIENVVASSGTSLTTGQIRLIRRYTRNITVLYDGDEAGLKATFRGTDMILEEGMNVRIIMFPEGEDPDSFVRGHRVKEVEDFLRTAAKDFITFKLELLLKDSAGDPVKKAGVIHEILQSISVIPDPITRSLYIRECSDKMEMDEQTLIHQLNKLLRKRLEKKAPQPQETAPAEYLPPQQTLPDHFSTEHQERDIIRLLLNYGHEDIIIHETDEHNRLTGRPVNVARFINDDIRNDDLSFTNSLYQKIFEEYTVHLERGESPDAFHFVNHPNQEVAMLAIDLTTSRYELSENWEQKHRIFTTGEEMRLFEAVVNSILSFKAKRIGEMIRDIQEQMRHADNEDDMNMLIARFKTMKQISRTIHDRLGRVITY
ncbi:MAG: DNA primase [Bacteroidales bacterium]|nr:DNA primase [Bacteroidales bacterium]